MTDQPTTAAPAEPIEIDPTALVRGGTHVHVVNAETGGEWDCPVDFLPVAVQRGWVPAVPVVAVYDDLFDPGTGPEPGEPGGEPEETGFDPNEHTVAEVNAYLDSLDGQAPGEVARVLEVERAGQNRKGIVEGPHAPADTPTDTVPPADNGSSDDTPTDDASLDS